MGQFFASRSVRRECGGFPLSDGPRYHWFIVRRKQEHRVLGFISIEEHDDKIYIRHGYLRPEARGRGLFRELFRLVIDYADQLACQSLTRQPASCARYLASLGFKVEGCRGQWATFTRIAHARSHQNSQSGRGNIQRIRNLTINQRIDAINRIRRKLHNLSPFVEEPVDCIEWVSGDSVRGNDYNPNTVAPPEMRLLARSIDVDGFTQPIVVHAENTDHFEVVYGFHRHRVGTKTDRIRQRLRGYLPIVRIRSVRTGKPDRIAATIRHNRARGIHAVPSMVGIVVSLLKAGWSEDDVAKQLGMDSDEVLRFKQVSGLPELFSGHQYSEAWE